MKDNMEELQRWENDLRYGNPLSRAEDGAWVRFSDVQEREARFQARIEELEGIVSGKTMYDAASVADARWRERIERLVERLHDEPGSQGYWLSKQVRSLLDSGEEQKASEPAIYEGYGRKWERVKGTSALREVGDTGPDWDQCVYHMIGGRVQRFLMAEREARPSPSPALEGREGQTASFTVSSERHEWPDANGPGDGGSASGVTTDVLVDSEAWEDENGDLVVPADSTTAVIAELIIEGMTDHDDDPAWVQRAIRARANRVADDIFLRIAQGQQPETGVDPEDESPPSNESPVAVPEKVEGAVMGSGKVEVEASDLESLLDTYDRPGNEVTARLRAVLEQERGEGCDR